MTAVGCASASEDEESSEAADTACRATSRDATGPYFEPGSPFRTVQIAGADEPGVRLAVEGALVGPDCRTPLAGYALDVWQADAQGHYYQGGTSNYRLRGKVKTDASGRYRFETILPGRYSDDVGMRPAHLHVDFLSPGGNVILTTQLYFAGDPYLGPRDYCTREGTCDSADPRRHLVLRDGLAGHDGTVGKVTSFDAVLPRT